jgi:hypothetical protein
MMKGLGRIQRRCLRVIGEYDAAGKRPTMLNITSEVYQVRSDRLSDAQMRAARRAVASLLQKGLVSGHGNIP